LSSASQRKCCESRAFISSRGGAAAGDPSALVATTTAERAPVLITELTIEQPAPESARRQIVAARRMPDFVCMGKLSPGSRYSQTD
jgi:hypothetical protein